MDCDIGQYIFYLLLEDKVWQVVSAEYYEEEIPEPTAKETLDSFYESILDDGEIKKDILVEKIQDKDIQYFVCPDDAFLYYIMEEDEEEDEVDFKIVLSDDESYGQGFVRLIKEEGAWLISSVTCVIDD